MSAVTTSAPAGSSSGGDDKGLRQGAIGLLSTTVIAISSTAPAYSLAAALGFIVIIPGMGFHAPGVILLAFVPMILVAQGYSRLNKEMPDCGTTFTWGAKTFGPITGWLGGWAIVAADVIVMANLAAVAGQYMFKLFGANGLANSTVWTTAAGIAWIVVMCAICYIGIEISTAIQYGLLIIEIIMLGILSVVALVKVYAGSAPHAAAADIKQKTFGAGPHHVAASWFNPFGASFSGLGAGLLLAVFIYWGWDTAVSVNEETKDKDKTPGRAAVLATLVLLGTYLLVSVSAQAFAGLGQNGIGLGNQNNSGDVLSVLGGSVFGNHGFGWFLAKLLVFMVLTSSMASTLTTILPTARTTLSMSVYKALPSKFARIHPKYLTPTWSTVGMGVISIVFFVLMAAINQNLLNDMIDAIGFPIAFYYWHPVNSYTSFDGTGNTWITGIGCLVLGAVLMLIWRALRPAYFRGEVLNKDTPVLVPDGDNLAVAAAAGLAEPNVVGGSEEHQ